MHEIICPHCSKAFKIDEAGYADILKQVRDGAFEQQLHERLELAEQDKRNAVELAQAQVASDMQKSAVAKDSEIQALKAKLDAGEVARKLAVTEALSDVQKERDALANELAQANPRSNTKTQWSAIPLRITKLRQPSNLAQVPRLVKVTTISRHQHRARYRQCNCVVERVEQVVVKLVRQFNGFGVCRGGRCPGDVELGQIINTLLGPVWRQT